MQQSEVNRQVSTVYGETGGSTDVVELLINDHQKIRALLTQLQNAEESQGRAAVKELQAILTVHNATEENLVYPALAVTAGELLEPRKLYFETAEADMMLFKLDNIVKGALQEDFKDTAEKFVAALTKHIETEENHAFKHLREKVDSGELAHLNSAVHEYRSKLSFASKPTTSTGTM